MMLHADSYFQIGVTHLHTGVPCQDYARSGVENGIAYGVISDGCSSGEDTDLGARFITLATERTLRHTPPLKIGDEVVHELVDGAHDGVFAEMQKRFGVGRDSLLATNVYAAVSRFAAVIRVLGDGVVAVVYRDGRMHLRRFEWAENLPFYPSYRRSELTRFVEALGARAVESPFSEELACYSASGELEAQYVRTHSLSYGMRGARIVFTAEELREVEYVGVFSDGVSQVDNYSWTDAVRTFLSFKQTKGAFLKRRMIRGVKEMHSHGRGPFDDLSAAVIHISSDTEEVSYEQATAENDRCS